jgi:hypothetical protein
MLAEAEEADAAEDALFGDDRGDELPAELADPVTRRQRIAAAAAQLEAGRRAAQDQQDALARGYLDAAAAGTPRHGSPPASAAVELAQRAVDRAVAARAAQLAARGDASTAPEDYCRVQEARAKLERAKARAARARRQAAAKAAARTGPGPVANITDPHSHLMPVRGGGFVQGYNAQAAHSRDGLCLGGLVTTQTTDYACFPALLEVIAAAQDILRGHARGPLNRKKARTGIVLADAGYLSEHNLSCPGPDRLIATGTRRGLARAGATSLPRQPAGRGRSPAVTAMAARITTPPGPAFYKMRGPIAEGPFGNHKHNRGFRQFSMRGLARVSGEWTFQNLTANLLKIHATGWQPA